MSVPRMVATIVEMNAMTRLLRDRLGQPGPAERVEPRVDREAAPGQVRSTGRVVEAEQDHDHDRQDR